MFYIYVVFMKIKARYELTLGDCDNAAMIKGVSFGLHV